MAEAAEGEEDKKKEEESAKKIVHTYPLVRYSDMVEEIKNEVIELVVTACEKFADNNEASIVKFGRQPILLKMQISQFHSDRSDGSDLIQEVTRKFVECLAARMVKEAMDKKFGPPWQVVVGEGYGFEITYEIKNLMYMFFGGNVAVCVWKI